MPRPEFTGPTDIVAQSGTSVKFKNFDQTTDVGAGTVEKVTATAPPGRKWTILAATFYAPAPGGTTGDHKLAMKAEKENIPVTAANSPYGSSIYYTRSRWEATNSFPIEDNQLQAVQSLEADDTNGIRWRYENNTDAIQTGTRWYRVVIREEVIE